jgi:hypothetical protein
VRVLGGVDERLRGIEFRHHAVDGIALHIMNLDTMNLDTMNLDTMAPDTAPGIIL